MGSRSQTLRTLWDGNWTLKISEFAQTGRRESKAVRAHQVESQK